jgi:hypothetical protein
MSRRLFTLALSALFPCAAHAATSPANSTIPSFVLMVGLREGVPDTTLGAFTIVARDFANNPDVGKLIEFRILNCPAARLAADQLQPGISTRCATHGVTAITDVNGMVRFAVVGGSEIDGLHGMGPCAQVYSGGVAIGTARVAYLDLDGSGGLGANDLAVWLSDFGTGEPIGRSDFNGDQQLTADDLSVWLQIWADGRQVESPAAYCP